LYENTKIYFKFFIILNFLPSECYESCTEKVLSYKFLTLIVDETYSIIGKVQKERAISSQNIQGLDLNEIKDYIEKSLLRKGKEGLYVFNKI
jgi:hypothetical protein